MSDNFHFRGGGGVFWKVLKCQDVWQFSFWGGGRGVFWNWKVKVPRSLTIFSFGGGGGILKLKSQSAKISDNFHFRGRGGILKSQSAKMSDNFLFLGGRGYSETEKSKCQDLWQFSFSGGGGVFWNWKVKVPRSLTIFIWGGGGILKLYFRIGVFCRIWTKISTTPAGSCITDSLSHTTYVETKKQK